MPLRTALALLLFVMATSLLPAQSGDAPYVIRQVRVFDGETVAEGQTVVITSPAEALRQTLAFGVTTAVAMWAAPRLKELEAADAPDMSAIVSAGTGATAPGGHPAQMGGPPIPTLTAPGEADTMKHAKPQFRNSLEMPAPPSTLRCGAAPQAVRQLSTAGVPLLAGTDSPYPGTTYGASLHRELEHLVNAGLTPIAALAAATSATARACRMTDRGRIRTGMRADLLLVDGDPSKQIRATRNIVAIWKRGVRVQRAPYGL